MVVNNAAIYAHEWDQKTFGLVKATNYQGPVTMVQKLTPLMQPGAHSTQLVSLLRVCQTQQTRSLSTTVLPWPFSAGYTHFLYRQALPQC